MTRLITVIMCTCNRPEALKEALISIAKQELDGSFDFEVIVMDNTTSGAMKSAVDAVMGQLHGRLRYIIEPVQGKSRALNHAIREAKGEILAFTDDDIIADPHWLKTVNKTFDLYKCDGVGGRVLPIYPEGTPQWVKDHSVQLAGGVVIYDYKEDDFLYTSKFYPFIGANFAFKREVFRDCGNFRIELGPGTPIMGEDTELVERFEAKGKKLYYCGRALIWHPVDLKRLSLRHMAKWHIALGRFAALREVENNIRISSYFLGVPRYLWKGLMLDAFTVILSTFNRIKFTNAWRSLFRRVGMIKQYRLGNQKFT